MIFITSYKYNNKRQHVNIFLYPPSRPLRQITLKVKTRIKFARSESIQENENHVLSSRDGPLKVLFLDWR